MNYHVDDLLNEEAKSAIPTGLSVPFSKFGLNLYDALVFTISNRYFWRCPTDLFIKFYNDNVSNKHLDVGVGTGFLLEKCRFPSADPHISLVDLNRDPLLYVRERIKHYPNVRLYRRNILEPLQINDTFDSIGLNYLLHCVRGPLEYKADKALGNLKSCLNEKGVLFGSTLIQDLANDHPLSKFMTGLYNRAQTFAMQDDLLSGLHRALEKHFTNYEVRTVGCVALFRAQR